jgi:hypothetical protein
MRLVDPLREYALRPIRLVHLVIDPTAPEPSAGNITGEPPYLLLAITANQFYGVTTR